MDEVSTVNPVTVIVAGVTIPTAAKNRSRKRDEGPLFAADPDWQDRDSLASWELGIADAKRRVENGEPLPEWLRPREGNVNG